jgi:hypothetical protein
MSGIEIFILKRDELMLSSHFVPRASKTIHSCDIHFCSPQRTYKSSLKMKKKKNRIFVLILIFVRNFHAKRSPHITETFFRDFFASLRPKNSAGRPSESFRPQRGKKIQLTF